ncbi:flagellar basal body L-ring protein FlgH [Selenihalanaerobacter shriftii]|uniref:Flagellar L-ring protein n=1 Tax=Selenihalanaerobacter shriftii TaxID=142842 RepID=A0A1T4KZ77_9FIRM|nr:flagellar basal body L-ring protein FlgH [Selenihalanaerobacter shriftii]SJZ47739.1 flagellar L-ring protein precursor FlgH [Selenihalanaerobacter shriftii]
MNKFHQKFLMIVMVMFCFIFLMSASSLAVSLYEDAGSLYDEHKAKNMGDILTVIIQEQSAATQEADTDTEQSNELEVSPGGGLLDFIKMLRMSQEDSSSASGSTSQSGNLSARMTVQVVQVLANDNLRIHGVKEITINEETQKIELSGIVRPEDITVNNTIDSTQIANGKITYDGEGAIGDKQRPGLFTRVLNILF